MYATTNKRLKPVHSFRLIEKDKQSSEFFALTEMFFHIFLYTSTAVKDLLLFSPLFLLIFMKLTTLFVRVFRRDEQPVEVKQEEPQSAESSIYGDANDEENIGSAGSSQTR